MVPHQSPLKIYNFKNADLELHRSKIPWEERQFLTRFLINYHQASQLSGFESDPRHTTSRQASVVLVVSIRFFLLFRSSYITCAGYLVSDRRYELLSKMRRLMVIIVIWTKCHQYLIGIDRIGPSNFFAKTLSILEVVKFENSHQWRQSLPQDVQAQNLTF